MKIKTSELIDGPLDWAAAKAEGLLETMQGDKEPQVVIGRYGDKPQMQFNPLPDVYYSAHYSPSTRWEHAGWIIERELIAIDYDHDAWNAAKYGLNWYVGGPTPLIAAMRCYVASKLGDEVEVPDELVQS